jgi:hypothetical protein
MPQTTQPKPKEGGPGFRGTARSTGGVLHSSMAHLLVVLVLMVIAAPFIEQIPGGDLIEAGLITLVFLAAVLAVGGRGKALVWAIVLVIPALVGKWANHLRPDLMPREIFMGGGLLFVLYVVVSLLGFILRAPRVNSEILCAGIATYLMLGWLWAIAYTLVARLVPDSFVFTAGADSIRSMERFRSLYFSYATLTTVGYGDIIPVSALARMLAMLEAIAGMFYMTLMIARLVTLYYSKSPSNDVSG